MSRTIFETPGVSHAARWLCVLYLRVTGWRKVGDVPDPPKYVVIIAPHTSNWDFPILVALAFALRVSACWMGKASLFRWPFGVFFRWLGGIPIDRSAAHNVVDQCVRRFDESDKMVLGLTPEGTRKKVEFWKTGFYHIARGAHVPIALAFVDYERKVGGFGPVIVPTGDLAADMAPIRTFFGGVVAKYPEKTGPAAVRPRDEELWQENHLRNP